MTAIDAVFLLGTGLVAVHAIRKGLAGEKPDMVRLLFGSIAAFFFVFVLLRDVLAHGPAH